MASAVQRLVKLLRPPIFEDEEQSRIARILHVVGLVACVGITIEFLSQLNGENRFAPSLLIGLFVAVVGTLLLARRGHIRSATLLILSSSVLAATLLMATGNGIRDLAILLFPLIIAVSGLFLNPVVYAILVVSSLFSVAAVGYLEITGSLPLPQHLVVTPGDVMDGMVIISITAVVIWLFTSNLLSSLVRARKRERELTETNLLLQRQAEELGKSESQWHSLVEHAPDLIMTLAPDGTIRFSNVSDPVRQTKLNATALTSLVVGEDKVVLEKALAGIRDERRPVGLDLQLLIGESPEWYSIRFAPILEHGAVRQITLVARNTTELRAAEEERLRIETRLRDAQKLESLGTLAGGIAHDFNNILAVIMGNASLALKKDEKLPALHDRVDQINKAAVRGAGLVKQILTFARKSDIQLQTVDVSQVIEEIRQIIEGTFPKSIELRIEQATSIPPILIDPAQLHQALLNLCINARDAMDGTGRLVIRLRMTGGASIVSLFPKAAGKRYVQIEVADTGIGMDERTRLRIFEPFFTTKEPGKGTGLGLAVVHGIVTSHHGFLHVTSHPGEGSTFYMYFPVSGVVENIQEPVSLRMPDRCGGNETILLVDDEEFLLQINEAALEQAGYAVHVAASGKQAMEVFRMHTPGIRLVVTDFDMPGMNGEEVCRALRLIDEKVKIIVVSGYLQHDAKQRLRRMNVEEFLSKPFSPDTFLSTIRSVLDRT